MRTLTFPYLKLKSRLTGLHISTAGTSQAGRSVGQRASSTAEYSRQTSVCQFEHKRTEAQFETAWNELQAAVPKAGDQGFLLGVSGNKLLLDGIPLETGQAERSFAQLLTTAGLASINFSNQVTIEDFARLVRAFALGGSKGQDVAKQIKDTLGDGRGTSIKINEVKFVAADSATGEVTIAAQIAAQTLGQSSSNG